MLSLAKWLAKELEAKNVRSLRHAARQIGVAHTTIQRILAGNSVDVATIDKLSEWSGTPRITLLKHMGIHFPETDPKPLEWNKLMHQFPSLEDALQLMLDQYEAEKITDDVILQIAEYIRFSLREK